VTPQIVLSVRESLPEIAPKADGPGTEQSLSGIDIGLLDFPMPMSNNLGHYNMGEYDELEFSGAGPYPDVPGLFPQNLDLDHLDWSAMDWNLGSDSSGGTGPKGPEQQPGIY
jgi:hypothetical protein